MEKKVNKGIRDQSEDTNLKYEEFTLEKLKEVIKDLTFRDIDSKSSILMYQVCKTYGEIERSISNLNICDDPTCVCQEWDKAIKDSIERKE